jgi:serine/threonine-protein kinase HipA
MSSDAVTNRRRALVYQGGVLAGALEEVSKDRWQFCYVDGYGGIPISLTMPVTSQPYHFNSFPAVFDGLLPEGPQLEALLRKHKIDRSDAFKQLVTVGEDLVGSLSIRLPKQQASKAGEGA